MKTAKEANPQPTGNLPQANPPAQPGVVPTAPPADLGKPLLAYPGYLQSDAAAQQLSAGKLKVGK